MSHLHAFFVANVALSRFSAKNFGVEFYAEFLAEFSEIRRILAEILMKKLAGGASVVHIVEAS